MNPSSSSYKVDEMEQLFALQQTSQSLCGGSKNELQEYLDSGKFFTFNILYILIKAL